MSNPNAIPTIGESDDDDEEESYYGYAPRPKEDKKDSLADLLTGNKDKEESATSIFSSRQEDAGRFLIGKRLFENNTSETGTESETEPVSGTTSGTEGEPPSLELPETDQAINPEQPAAESPEPVPAPEVSEQNQPDQKDDPEIPKNETIEEEQIAEKESVTPIKIEPVETELPATETQPEPKPEPEPASPIEQPQPEPAKTEEEPRQPAAEIPPLVTEQAAERSFEPNSESTEEVNQPTGAETQEESPQPPSAEEPPEPPEEPPSPPVMEREPEPEQPPAKPEEADLAEVSQNMKTETNTVIDRRPNMSGAIFAFLFANYFRRRDKRRQNKINKKQAKELRNVESELNHDQQRASNNETTANTHRREQDKKLADLEQRLKREGLENPSTTNLPEQNDQNIKFTPESLSNKEKTPENAPVSIAEVLAASTLAEKSPNAAPEEPNPEEREQNQTNSQKEHEQQTTHPQETAIETNRDRLHEATMDKHKETQGNRPPQALLPGPEEHSYPSTSLGYSSTETEQSKLQPALAKTDLFSQETKHHNNAAKDDIYKKSIINGFVVGLILVTAGAIVYILTS